MKRTYLITYKAYDKNNKIIAEGQYKVKNQDSELAAKINFENYLKKKLINYHHLYISECKEQLFNAQFGDIFNDIFNDIFCK